MPARVSQMDFQVGVVFSKTYAVNLNLATQLKTQAVDVLFVF